MHARSHIITHHRRSPSSIALLLVLASLGLLVSLGLSPFAIADEGEPQTQPAADAGPDSAVFVAILDDVQRAYREGDIAPIVAHLESEQEAPPADAFARMANTAFGQFYADSLELLPDFTALPKSTTWVSIELEGVGGRKVRGRFLISLIRPQVGGTDDDGGDDEAPVAFEDRWVLGSFDGRLLAPALAEYEASMHEAMTDPDYEEPAKLVERAADDLDPSIFEAVDDTDLAVLVRDYVDALRIDDDDEATERMTALLWQDPNLRDWQAIRARRPLMRIANVFDCLDGFPDSLSGLPARMSALEVSLDGHDERDGRDFAWQIRVRFAREFDDWYIERLRVGVGRHLDGPDRQDAFALTPQPVDSR